MVNGQEGLGTKSMKGKPVYIQISKAQQWRMHQQRMGGRG